MEKYMEMGVDGIITNKPDVARAVVTHVTRLREQDSRKSK